MSDQALTIPTEWKIDDKIHLIVLRGDRWAAFEMNGPDVSDQMQIIWHEFSKL